MLKPTGTHMDALKAPPQSGQQGLSATGGGRTSEALRDLIWDEIEALRVNLSDAKRANAVAALAKTLLESVRLDLEYQRLLQDQGKLSKGLELGQLRIGKTQGAK